MFFMLLGFIFAEGNSSETQACSLRGQSGNPCAGKSIIWYHNIHYSSVDSLRTILQAGFVTHVMLALTHRNDLNHENVIELGSAISEINKHAVQIIWTRPLWPVDKLNGFKEASLHQAEYYVQEIQMLRQEAKEVGADLTGLDVEPYGNVPVKRTLKSYISKNDLESLKKAVERASEKYTVDYILPAGSINPGSAYNQLAKLGVYRISEDTYYFYKEEKWRKINYQYDIAGIYLEKSNGCNTMGEKDIRDIISDGLNMNGIAGIFIYPKENNAEEVSSALSRIFKNAVLSK
jgi:hypothetical protein